MTLLIMGCYSVSDMPRAFLSSGVKPSESLLLLILYEGIFSTDFCTAVVVVLLLISAKVLHVIFCRKTALGPSSLDDSQQLPFLYLFKVLCSNLQSSASVQTV